MDMVGTSTAAEISLEVSELFVSMGGDIRAIFLPLLSLIELTWS